MEIKTIDQNGVTIVQICGRLDANTASEAQDKIMPLIVSECALVIDLKECDYISSAGLRLLLMIARQLPSKQGRCVLCGLSDELRDIMEMTGFIQHFKTCDTLSTACQVIGKEKK